MERRKVLPKKHKLWRQTLINQLNDNEAGRRLRANGADPREHKAKTSTENKWGRVHAHFRKPAVSLLRRALQPAAPYFPLRPRRVGERGSNDVGASCSCSLPRASTTEHFHLPACLTCRALLPLLLPLGTHVAHTRPLCSLLLSDPTNQKTNSVVVVIACLSAQKVRTPDRCISCYESFTLRHS